MGRFPKKLKNQMKRKQIPNYKLQDAGSYFISHLCQFAQFCMDMEHNNPHLDWFFSEPRWKGFLYAMECIDRAANTIANHAKTLEWVTYSSH